MRATIIQRPVGQGGLCEGGLLFDGEAISWLYDCGSDQTSSLEREIEKVAPTLKLLFISHLHADHVSGIDRLMLHSEVEEVVLPYLNDAARLLVAAQAIEQGRISGLFLEFLEDPAAWLQARGAQRVTFIGDADDLGDDFPPFTPREPRKPDAPGSEKSLKAQMAWDVEPEEFAQGIRTARPGAMLQFVGAKSYVDWCFLPYAHGPPKKMLAEFKAALEIEFPNTTDRAIAAEAKTKSGRDKLEACYAMLWTDHNLVSMSLYAGPMFADPHIAIDSGGVPNWRGHSRWTEHGSAAGWLATGDANLQRKGRRNSFLRAYGHFLPRTGVLVVPHHGAANSWHDALLAGFPGLVHGIAAAGPNKWGHPHRAVIDAFARRGVPFSQVDELRQTQLTIRVP